MTNDALTPEERPRGFRKFVKLRRWHAVAIAAVVVVVLLLSIVRLDQTGLITRAKSATALSTATSLETALNAFYSEYSALPHVGSQITTDSAEGRKFLEILTGIEPKSGAVQNQGAIKFLSVKEGENRKNGMIYDATGKIPEALLDPWGAPYTVILDTDFDQQLHFKLGDQSYDLKGHSAAVVSPGPDGRLGTGDDVRTW